MTLETCYLKIRGDLKGQPELLEFLESRYQDLKKVYQEEAIEYCINSFVETELDYKTPGERGLGRITTETPRFGAYYRDELKNLDRGKIENIAQCIHDIILMGYTFWAIYTGKTVQSGKYSDGKVLYKKWIELAYAGDPSEMGQELLEGLAGCVDSTRKKLHDYLYSYGMKKITTTTRDQITTWYVLIGVSLRSVELR